MYTIYYKTSLIHIYTQHDICINGNIGKHAFSMRALDIAHLRYTFSLFPMLNEVR